MKPSLSILQKTGECFTKARENIFEGIAGLHEIFEKELWKDEHNSFGEYVEEVCQLNPSQASRYLKVYRHYVLSGSFSMLNVSDTDPEKLYLAASTKGTPEEQYERARSLSRKELKEELAVKPDGSEHDHDFHEYCSVCWTRR